MSLHGLSMKYIEPVEYANLGLLAVAFVSLSSPDVDIRKLGYKVVEVLKGALEEVSLVILVKFNCLKYLFVT